MEKILYVATKRCSTANPVTSGFFCRILSLLFYTAQKYKESHPKRADDRINVVFKDLLKLVWTYWIERHFSASFGNPYQRTVGFQREYATKELKVTKYFESVCWGYCVIAKNRVCGGLESTQCTLTFIFCATQIGQFLIHDSSQ